MENITSKNNGKIKYAVSVKENSSVRKKDGVFFAEGARLSFDAAESGVDILQFFFTSKAKEKFSSYWEKIIACSEESWEISEEISRKLSDTQTPQGIFCVCRSVDKIFNGDKINSKGKYILLENVQDPSNIGTVARTAEAFGLDGMIVCGGCDIFNPKALRASMGAFFRLSVINCGNLPELIADAKKRGMTVAASTPDSGVTNITKADLSSGIICIVGNEGNGVSKETLAAATLKVTIPMGGRAESLNASTAAAILIWEMVRNGS